MVIYHSDSEVVFSSTIWCAIGWNMHIADQFVAFSIRFLRSGIMNQEYKEMIQRMTAQLRRYELSEEFEG